MVVVVAVLLALACVDLALFVVLAAGPGWAATAGRLTSGPLVEQLGGLAQALRLGLVTRSRTRLTG